MYETDPTPGEEIKQFAIENHASPFDIILPNQPTKLSILQKRIIYQTYAGTTKIITLRKQNKYFKIIFKVCAAGLQSEWFDRISDGSKSRYYDKVRHLFNWINGSGYKTTPTKRYKVLKDFEAYLMNEKGLKNSTLGSINTVLTEGLSSLLLTKEDHDYIIILVSSSKPFKRSEAAPTTLSNWIKLPWLRGVIGQKNYMQLESPRLLLTSFRVTIATSLLWLLEQRRQWNCLNKISFEKSNVCWYYDWNPLLIKHIGKSNDKSESEDDFKQLLILDLIMPKAQKIINDKFNKDTNEILPKSVLLKKTNNPPWQRPIFFHPDYQNQYSPIEELLCAWLIACEAIQPSDIIKLKTSNYASERNRFGKLIAMECTYYKGRSGNYKQPSILIGSDPWTQAMDKYMAGLPGETLFRTRITTQNKFPALNRKHNVMSFLIKLWKLPSFQKLLNEKLDKADATSIFTRAMLALELSNENYTMFYKRTGKGAEEYQAITSKPLPISFFTLTHIKTTAVHAGSDTYRDADLINNHSHTSLTEKISYLTDENKDWVNQAHRITRLVLNDLQNVVFQPSITEISQSVRDLKLRTQIIEATNTNDIEIYSLKNSLMDYDDGDYIIVSDTTDSAIYFIHYITQAEQNLKKLLTVRPDWVERTLIVQIEWMTCMLKRMSSAAAAKKDYVKLAVHLPPLFDHILETTA